MRSTALWQLNSAALIAMQEFLPEGLFSNSVGKEGRFEDPVFYRKGEFMLGVVSHENEGIVRVTATEYRLLEAQGFNLRHVGTMVGY
jgi:hypothetical protein